MKLMRPTCLISLIHATANVQTHTHTYQKHRFIKPMVPNVGTIGATYGFKRIPSGLRDMNTWYISFLFTKKVIPFHALEDKPCTTGVYRPCLYPEGPAGGLSWINFDPWHEQNVKSFQVTYWNHQKVSVCSCLDVQARGSSRRPQPPQYQAERCLPWEPQPTHWSWLKKKETQGTCKTCRKVYICKLVYKKHHFIHFCLYTSVLLCVVDIWTIA